MVYPHLPSDPSSLSSFFPSPPPNPLDLSTSYPILLSHLIITKISLLPSLLKPSREALLTDTVLIQPNLRFFHELFGWEVELARREEDERLRMVQQAQEQGLEAGVEGLELGGRKREIMYSWPSFCRDLVSPALFSGSSSNHSTDIPLPPSLASRTTHIPFCRLPLACLPPHCPMMALLPSPQGAMLTMNVVLPQQALPV